ncbi:hypothetical protein FB451DRAFT_1400609 [Mycena latifolia]|nr:hypothetical protein FB451DRAFT_1400609 [Mycena latifolia]
MAAENRGACPYVHSGPERTDGGPPTYTSLRKWEAALPQNNLSLPFPEGKAGRYVKFSKRVLINAHLASVSGRTYVFQDYYRSYEHYQWPKERWESVTSRTSFNAIVSGPVAGEPFELDDPVPRADSEDWFDVVALLQSAPERCIEIVEATAAEDSFPQSFDLSLWGSPRLLSLWPSFAASPISHNLGASPIVRAVERNTYLFLWWGVRPPHPAPRDPFTRMLALHQRIKGSNTGVDHMRRSHLAFAAYQHIDSTRNAQASMKELPESFASL